LNLRHSIPLTLLVTGLAPALLVAGLYSFIQDRESRVVAAANLAAQVSSTAGRIDDFTRTIMRDLRALAGGTELKQGAPEPIEQLLKRHSYTYPYFRDLFWISPAGVVIADEDGEHAGEKIGGAYPDVDRAFRNVLASPAGAIQVSDLDEISDVRRETADPGVSQPLSLQYFVRVDDASGGAVGVLGASISTESILSMLREMMFRNLSLTSVLLVNTRGEVLLDVAGVAAVLTRDPLLGPMNFEAISTVFTDRIEDPRHGALIVAAAPTLGSGSGGRWFVFAAQPEAAAIAATTKTLVITARVAIGVALLIGVLATLAARRWTRRLADLTAVAEAFGEGGLNVRATDSGRDELSTLATAFNRMANKIAELVTAKDKDADQLTHMTVQLDESNQSLAKTLQCAQQRNAEIGLMAEATGALQAALDYQESAVIIARYLGQLFSPHPGGVYLARSSLNHFELLAQWGNGDLRAGFEPADCWALRRGQLYRVSPGSAGLPCEHVKSDAQEPGAYLCVPLVAQGTTLGLLHLRTPEQLLDSTPHRDLAQSVAGQLALALGNLKLRETLREQSIRDGLTGLFNRRYLEESLQREVARAQRSGQLLAVFMLDVDHFKKFNDTHGHEAGDAVLRDCGRLLISTCRASDFACRFGGEEFTVVLTDSGRVAAEAWGQRLMERVRAMKVRSSQTSLDRITVSIGLALFPEHGADAETLLQAADIALYEAKRNGRDRLVICGIPAPAPAPVHAL
jgi:diguanylate cyclase (GGDEF)-like protein